MATKTIDVITILAAALIVFCVFGSRAALVMGVSFPDWSGVGSDASQLEGRMLQEIPQLSFEDVISGKTQSQTDKFLSDAVPFRDQVLLYNARPQRACIEFSNLFFGFKAYHSFYGSVVCAVPESATLVHPLEPANAGVSESTAQWCQVLVKAAEEYPDTRFVYQIVGHPTTCEFSPLSTLVSYGICDSYWVESYVKPKIEGSRVKFLHDPICSYEDYISGYFTTEGHWTHERALRAYNQLSAELDWTFSPTVKQRKVSDVWYGAGSRGGRMIDWSSVFWDSTEDYSQLDVRNPGMKDEAIKEHSEVSCEGEFDLYNRYYAALNNEVINNGPNNGRTCLVVCTSYAASLIDPISSNYRKTVFICPTNTAMQGNLNDYLEQGFDDVIIQHLPHSALPTKQRSPSFFQ